MATVLYPKGKENFIEGNIDLVNDTIKVALIDTGVYTYSASHEFYSDVSGVVGTDATLSSKTTTNGVFDAATLTFTAVSGATIEAVIVYQDTGVAGTSRLIAYIDNAPEFPVTPVGGNIEIQWDSGASKIFAL